MNTKISLKKKSLYWTTAAALVLQCSSMAYGMEDNDDKRLISTKSRKTQEQLTEHLIETIQEHRSDFKTPLAKHMEETLDKFLTQQEDAQLAASLQIAYSGNETIKNKIQTEKPLFRKEKIRTFNNVVHNDIKWGTKIAALATKEFKEWRIEDLLSAATAYRHRGHTFDGNTSNNILSIVAAKIVNEKGNFISSFYEKIEQHLIHGKQWKQYSLEELKKIVPYSWTDKDVNLLALYFQHRDGNCKECTTASYIVEKILPIVAERKNYLATNIFALYEHNVAHYLQSSTSDLNDEVEDINDIEKKWRFIPVKNGGNTYLIKNIVNNNYLRCDDKQNVDFKSAENPDDSFYWTICKDERSPNYRINPFKQEFFLHFTTSENTENNTSHSKLQLGKQDNTSSAYAWQLRPKSYYSQKAGMDFNAVIEEMKNLLAKKYNMEGVQVNISSLHSKHSGETKVQVPADRVRIHRREIFSTTEKSDIQHPEGSAIRISRTIETETLFHTSLQNVLNHSVLENKNTGEAKKRNQQNMRGREAEDGQQEGYIQGQNKGLRKNRAEHREDMERFASAHSRGTHENKSETHNVSVEVNMQGSANFGVGKVSSGVKAGYGYNNNQVKGSNENHTDEKANEKRKGVKNENEEHFNEMYEKQHANNYRNLNRSEEVEGQEQESFNNISFSLQKSISLTKTTSEDKREKEVWYIEREVKQSPKSTLEIKYYEEDVEIPIYPYEVDVTLSGYVEFIFPQRIIGIGCSQYDDHLNGKSWFLTPATILNYLPVSGFHVSSEGLVNYRSKGVLKVKKPIRVFATITEIMEDKTRKPTEIVEIKK